MKKFLSKKEFSFKIVPEQRGFLDQLKVRSYPLYIIIDPEGKIINVATTIKSVEFILAKIIYPL
jgi:hypothetical protein